MKKLLSLLVLSVSIFAFTDSFATSPVGEYVFARRTPVVGQYVTVWGNPGYPCYEWSSTGDNPGNHLWWINKKMQVVAIGSDCNGTPNATMLIKAILPGSPYNNYTTFWPSDLYSNW
jgi:hypothetical protein